MSNLPIVSIKYAFQLGLILPLKVSGFQHELIIIFSLAKFRELIILKIDGFVKSPSAADK